MLFVYRELGEYDRAFRWLKAKAKSDDFRANEFVSIARDLREADNYSLAAEVYDFMIYSRPSAMQGGWLNQALEEQLEVLISHDKAKADDLVMDFGGKNVALALVGNWLERNTKCVYKL